MKMKYLLLMTLIFITTLNISEVFSQADPLKPWEDETAIFLGPVFGYNRSMHTVDLASFAKEPLCPFFKNGEGNGFYVGLSFEQFLDSKINSRHSLIAKVVYNYLPSSLEVKTDDRYPSLVDDGKVVNTATNNTIEVDYSLISVEVLYKFNPIENFELGLFVGPTFDFALSKKFEQKLLLEGPNNVQFIEIKDPEEMKKAGIVRYEDNLRTIVVNDEDVRDSNPFRLGIKAGIQYAIQFQGFSLFPQVAYNFGITKLSSSEDWRVNAFQVGIDMRFSISL